MTPARRDVDVRGALREPDLPRTAKVRTGPLRTGWTTGTCASAAAKAAVAALISGLTQTSAEVALPSGRRVTFPVARCTPAGDGWEAVVIKDAGDDPDVTDGAHLTVAVRWAAEPGVHLRSGPGVGTVTKPGLGLDVGGPAINPVPRRMIGAAIGEVTDPQRRGVEVTVSVPGGQQLARRTTNPRLGIVGGISILGTTGIVRPFSTASWRASVLQAVDVMAAQGERTCVLTTGGRTERAARRLLPDVPEVCFVEVGDFSGNAIDRAVDRGIGEVVFVGMAGKLTKLAAGIMMTHWTRSRVDTDVLAGVTARAGGDRDLVADVRAANTARHAYELWSEAGIAAAAADLLCAQVADNLRAWSRDRLDVHAVLVDFDTLEPVGASRHAPLGGRGSGR
ncbi:MAG: cobalt-precorrin-5B (C(1))-methyltransferase [Actinomycetota bacterium]|nr:cobalt-precorrin-5B (C(1))-methyltransferase [Actinomycetota bacterium]